VVVTHYPQVVTKELVVWLQVDLVDHASTDQGWSSPERYCHDRIRPKLSWV